MPSSAFDERRHRERSNPSTDVRSPYQRDRDRLLYSNAFRRLAGVTQVISPIEGDVVHNRLTHTLKVAQIARRLAEKLLRDLQQTEETPGLRPPDPDLAEASALAHDLGHPPFGHIGEHELNACLKNAEESEGYEGNAQSLRIVTKLSTRTTDYPGLNLTRGTMNGLMKYPWLPAEGKRKWGAYSDEYEDFRWTRDHDAVEKDTRTLESAIMDWADDVTYAVHDVQDFFRAGLIPLHILEEVAAERTAFLTSTRDRWGYTNPGRMERWDDYEQAFDELNLFPFKSSYQGDKQQQADLVAMGSELITRFISAATLVPAESGKSYELEISDSAQCEVSIMKALNWHYVIESTALRSQQFGLRQVIRDLFEIFSRDENRTLIPPWITGELDHDCSVNRRASDVISSLSDVQALRLHQRLKGNQPGSIRDWI